MLERIHEKEESCLKSHVKEESCKRGWTRLKTKACQVFG
jgi:hypothetical protein